MSDFIDGIKFIASVMLWLIMAILCIIFIISFLYVVSGAAEADKKKEQELHDCFIQEPRTKECEYIIWKEEQKNIKKDSSSDNLATGLIIGTTMGMAMRR